MDRIPFYSGAIEDLIGIAALALAAEPEVVVLVGTSVDGAVLAKEIRTQAPQVQIAASQTERLVELAGRYIEGAIVPQNFAADFQNPDFDRFRGSYSARFNQQPGIAALLGYDAARLALRGLDDKPVGLSLKAHILQISKFDGVMGQIVLDSFGDVNNRSHITRVVNGVFQIQDFQCAAG